MKKENKIKIQNFLFNLPFVGKYFESKIVFLQSKMVQCQSLHGLVLEAEVNKARFEFYAYGVEKSMVNRELICKEVSDLTKSDEIDDLFKEMSNNHSSMRKKIEEERNRLEENLKTAKRNLVLEENKVFREYKLLMYLSHYLIDKNRFHEANRFKHAMKTSIV